MPTTYKVLAQTNPGAATLVDAYTAPALTHVIESSFVVCNRSATPTTFRLSVAVAGAADDAKQYLFYDCPITGNNTFIGTVGRALGPGDVLRVYATLGTLSFNFFGAEVT